MTSRGTRWLWLRLLIRVVGVAGLVLGGAAGLHVRLERDHLLDDLERRARVLAKVLAVQAQRVLTDPLGIDRGDLADRLSGSGRTLGVVLCREDGTAAAVSSSVRDQIRCDAPQIAGVLGGVPEVSWRLDQTAQPLHAFALAIPGMAERIAGVLVVVHDASYIEQRVVSLLAWYATALGILGLLLTVSTVTGVRATFGRPLERLAEWMGRLRIAEAGEAEEPPPALPSLNLAFESERLAASFKVARTGMQALARQAAEADRHWTRDRLSAHVVELLAGAELVVVSNREPYLHRYDNGQIRVITPASGLVTALDPVLRACGGVWIAHGAADADRETTEARGRVVVPPGRGRYTLRRVWLSREEEEGYYYGFSNEGFWPLCHAAHVRPVFRMDDWEDYKTVNARFARAVLEEIGSRRAVVLVQDYHLALVPKLLKRARPDLAVSLFWHIPWPNPEAFRICPWKREILQGMLGADLVGFHVQYHCNNFLDTVDETLEARVDRDRFGVWQQERMTHVRPFPISVQPWDERDVPPKGQLASRLRQLRETYQLGDAVVAVGVDRIDYTKGIPDRIRAIARFLETNPAWIGRFVFVELGAPSREVITRYRDLGAEVEALTHEVNARFQTKTWKPVVMLRSHHSPQDVYEWLCLADLCIVSSLHDGMNLVAKEFVAARADQGGVLILSEFTGAARELGDALIVNPYATESFAQAIRWALEMPDDEKQERMRRLRRQVEDHNVYRWARDIISQTVRASRGVAAMEPVSRPSPVTPAAVS